jgi:hypothetical protein
MTAATGPERGPGGVRTLVLDVLGTVVDEAGSIQSQVMTALAAAGEDPAAGPELAARWTAATEAHTERIAAGQAPWRPNDEVRRAALLEAVAGDPGPAGPEPDRPARRWARPRWRSWPWPGTGSRRGRTPGRRCGHWPGPTRWSPCPTPAWPS